MKSKPAVADVKAGWYVSRGGKTHQEEAQMAKAMAKELREKAGIQAGNKLALTAWEKDGKVCCITMTKVEELADMVRATLGPVMKEIL